MNPRPLVPQTSALTGLRYAPTPGRACPTIFSAMSRNPRRSRIRNKTEPVEVSWDQSPTKSPTGLPARPALPLNGHAGQRRAQTHHHRATVPRGARLCASSSPAKRHASQSSQHDHRPWLRITEHTARRVAGVPHPRRGRIVTGRAEPLPISAAPTDDPNAVRAFCCLFEQMHQLDGRFDRRSSSLSKENPASGGLGGAGSSLCKRLLSWRARRL